MIADITGTFPRGAFPCDAPIESTIVDLIEALHAATPSAAARRLHRADGLALCADLRAALANAAPDDVRCVAVARGGFVPNSYRGRGESDTIRIEVKRADDGSWDLAGARLASDREPAQRRPNGRGNLIVIRLAKPGQREGRIV